MDFCVFGLMKSLVFQGAEKVIVNEREIPVLGENTALVRVDFCGICGSDMLIFSGKHPRVNSERILGHEFYGEVVDVKGDEVVVWRLDRLGRSLKHLISLINQFKKALGVVNGFN